MLKMTLQKNINCDIQIIKLEGNLDISVYSMLERNLSRLLLKNSDKVVLDFENIYFIDYSIMKLLREYEKIASYCKGEIHFFNLSEYNKKKLDLASVNKPDNLYFIN